MKVLLDTHTFLWLLNDDDRLSKTSRQTFLDSKNSLYFSAASLWEICIKMSLRKISLRSGWFETLQKEMQVNAIWWLPIEMSHCVKVTELPFHHRDPFDRILVAQAIIEDMKILSRDNQLSSYPPDRIW